jgi:NAD(P)-dependent dehydrogenase (short-subunit alcohol dehydrogenase family)
VQYRHVTGVDGALKRERAAAALRGEGLAATALPLDVNDEVSVQRAAQWIDVEHSRLDVLVNNAGVAYDLDSAETRPLDLVRATFETNVLGLIAVTRRRAVGRVSQRRGHGGLVAPPAPRGRSTVGEATERRVHPPLRAASRRAGSMKTEKNAPASSSASSGRTFATYWSGRTRTRHPAVRSIPRSA